MDSIGLTDHGVLHAIVDFYRKARTANIKPIIGMEAYLATASRRDRLSDAKKPYHLTLLAKDQTGYRNLLNLATKAQLEGYYYKPRIDRELLEQHGEGVIALLRLSQRRDPPASSTTAATTTPATPPCGSRSAWPASTSSSSATATCPSSTGSTSSSSR